MIKTFRSVANLYKSHKISQKSEKSIEHQSTLQERNNLSLWKDTINSKSAGVEYYFDWDIFSKFKIYIRFISTLRIKIMLCTRANIRLF